MKKSREIRRAEAIRKNRFGMLSWDPSRLFYESYHCKFVAGELFREDKHLTDEYLRLRVYDTPWAADALEKVRRDQQMYDKQSWLYYEYATIILMHRAKMSGEERCKIDMARRSSAPMSLPSDGWTGDT